MRLSFFPSAHIGGGEGIELDFFLEFYIFSEFTNFEGWSKISGILPGRKLYEMIWRWCEKMFKSHSYGEILISNAVSSFE